MRRQVEAAERRGSQGTAGAVARLRQESCNVTSPKTCLFQSSPTSATRSELPALSPPSAVQVCSGTTGHTEVVQVVYDPSEVI